MNPIHFLRQRVSFSCIVTSALTCALMILVEDSAAQARPGEEDVPTVNQDVPATPKKLLQLLGIPGERLDQIKDGSPLSEPEHETLLSLLFHLPRLTPADLDRWSMNASALFEEPSWESARFHTFRLQGRVTSVQRINISEHQHERFSFREYYRLTFHSTIATNIPITIFCREIPNAWQQASSNDADWGASLQGLFVKSADALFFVANRLAWHPSEPHETRSLDSKRSACWSLLGSHGFDIGSFDQLDQGTRMTGNDRAPFYGLLDAVSKMPAERVRQLATPNTSIDKLIQSPEALLGTAMQFTGIARRAIKIVVEDPDVRQNYGLQHYYEIELFIRLPVPLKILDPTTKKSVVYQEYPIVFCVRQLPPGMPEGASINKRVRIFGFYFKLWAFQNERMNQVFGRSEDGRRARALQQAPLLIGLPPDVLLGENASTSRRWELIASAGFIAMLIASWIVVAYYARQDRQHAKRHPREATDVDLSDFSP